MANIIAITTIQCSTHPPPRVFWRRPVEIEVGWFSEQVKSGNIALNGKAECPKWSEFGHDPTPEKNILRT
jgi:hypothetical protein